MSSYPFQPESNADSARRPKDISGIGQYLSDSVPHLQRMNRWIRWTARNSTECLIAQFGTGRLICCGGIRYELRGGNDWDFAAAREWAAHFLHEAIVDRPSKPQINASRFDGAGIKPSRCFGKNTSPLSAGDRL